MPLISVHATRLRAKARSRATNVHLTLSASFLTLVLLWSAEVRSPLSVVSGLAVVAVMGVIPMFTRWCRRTCRPGVLLLGYLGIPAAWAASLVGVVSYGSLPNTTAASIHAALLLACPIGYWLFLTLALRKDAPPVRVERASPMWQAVATAEGRNGRYTGSSRAATSRSKSRAPSNSL